MYIAHWLWPIACTFWNEVRSSSLEYPLKYAIIHFYTRRTLGQQRSVHPRQNSNSYCAEVFSPNFSTFIDSSALTALRKRWCACGGVWQPLAAKPHHTHTTKRAAAGGE